MFERKDQMKTFLTSLLFSVFLLAGCQVGSPRYDIKAHFGECPIDGKLCKVCQDGTPDHQYREPVRADHGTQSKAQAPSQEEAQPIKSSPSQTVSNASPVIKAAQEPVWNRIQQRGKMIVGVKSDTPPFSVMTDDNSFWGFEVDLVSAIAAEMGVDVEMVPVSAKQRIPYILQDKVDLVMATMTLTKKREARVDFSTPYFQVGQGLITAQGSPIDGFQGLDGKKVAVLEGTQAFHTLARIQPGCQLIIVSSYDEGLEKVIAGEVSSLCSDHLILMGLFHNHSNPEKLALVEQTFAPDSYAVAMRENESSLRDAINSAIMTTWEDGTWPDAFDTWFGPGSMYSHDSQFSIRLVPE